MLILPSIHFGRPGIAIWVAVDNRFVFDPFPHLKRVNRVYLKMLGRIWGNIITRVILPIYDKAHSTR